MLELRCTAESKRMAALRAAIAEECRRAKAEPEHGALIGRVAEVLIVGADGDGVKRTRRSDVFVIVTVQSDATMLMVRVARPAHPEFDEHRRRVLDEHTTRWSTMSGADGRTVWAEIPRPSRPAPAAPSAPAGRPLEAPAGSAPVVASVASAR